MNFNIEEAEVAPGTLGLLFDETPKLTIADVKPFVWSVLLYRGAVKRHEIVAALTPLCAHGELYRYWSDDLDEQDDRTRLEWLIDEVLGEMTAQTILRYSIDADLWVLELGENQRHLPTIIKAVAGVDGSLPKHLLMEMR